MSGIGLAAAGSGDSGVFSVTSVLINTGIYGFEVGVGGSVSPLYYKGVSVEMVKQDIVIPTFFFHLSNTGLARDFFTSLTINGNTLTSASASYSSGQWEWSVDTGIRVGTYTMVII